MDNAATELVCALSQPELQQRKSDIRANLTPHLFASSYAEGTSQLSFAKPAVSRAQLEHLVELERTCCPFLSFGIREKDNEIMVIVSGPEGSEDFVRDLFSCEQSFSCGCSGQASQENLV